MLKKYNRNRVKIFLLPTWRSFLVKISLLVFKRNQMLAGARFTTRAQNLNKRWACSIPSVV